MPTTRLIKDGDSQAVLIPDELAYENLDVELEIERVGEEIRIRPRVDKKSWEEGIGDVLHVSKKY